MRGHGTGAGQVPLSDALGCDSRGVRALAYINYMRRGFDKQEAGTENRSDGIKRKWRAAAGDMASYPRP